MTTVSTRSWKEALVDPERPYEWIHWDDNCQFVGHVISQTESTAKQCAEICLLFSDRQCTHYTHANGICYLKRNENGWQEIDEVGNTCGFVPGRSYQESKLVSELESGDLGPPN
jgi:hypothetical protein